MKQLFARLGLARYISRIIHRLNLQHVVHTIMSMFRPDRNYHHELQVVQKVLTTMPQTNEVEAGATWTATRVIPTLNDVAVVLVGPRPPVVRTRRRRYPTFAALFSG